jgi:hypothetical protein
MLIFVSCLSQAMEHMIGNPSSTHNTGLRAKALVAAARRAASIAVGATTANGFDPETIIFTSGATEGINVIAFSVMNTLANELRTNGTLARRVVLYGATEHKGTKKISILHIVCVSIYLPIPIPIPIPIRLQRSPLRLNTGARPWMSL